jgi:uncharacterized RDD family membrane protein YckC
LATDDAAARAQRAASLLRRFSSLIYESILLAAVLFAGALPFLILARPAGFSVARPFFQLYLLALCGAYFVWHWLHGGQTLPMKTWRIKLVTRGGGPLTLRRGVYRFTFALIGLALFGIGFLWAFIDRERQFLHDRLAGTLLVNSD